jgi:hypothetical protein
MVNKAEKVVNMWDHATIPGRYNLLEKLGLDGRIRVDKRPFEKLPQKDMLSIVKTAEVVL